MKRESYVYTGNGRVDHFVPVEVPPLEFVDGMPINVEKGFRVAAQYVDGCFHSWVLLAHDYGYMLYPEADYLPLYNIANAHNVVDLLKYLECTLTGVIDDLDFEN